MEIARHSQLSILEKPGARTSIELEDLLLGPPQQDAAAGVVGELLLLEDLLVLLQGGCIVGQSLLAGGNESGDSLLLILHAQHRLRAGKRVGCIHEKGQFSGSRVSDS